MLKENILSTQLTAEQIALFYLGQEGFLIKSHDKYLLFDPYLTDYVDRHCCTDTVLWKRKYPAPIQASELDFIDYVFCSHEHFDHADPDTLGALAKASPKAKFIVPAPVKNTICSYGIEASAVIPAFADEKLTLEKSLIEVTPLPAAHETLQINSEGQYENLAYLVQLENLHVFHAGDCCIYDGLKERLKNVNVALLPINGRDYYRYRNDIIGNMDSTEAILLAREIHADLLVPMHFDLYEINEVNPAYFVDCLFKKNPTQKLHIFAPGERYIYM